MTRKSYRQIREGFDIAGNAMSFLGNLVNLYTGIQARNQEADNRNKAASIYTDWNQARSIPGAVTEAEPVATTDPYGRPISMRTVDVGQRSTAPVDLNRLSDLAARFASSGVDPTFTNPYASIAEAEYKTGAAERERASSIAEQRRKEAIEMGLAGYQANARDPKIRPNPMATAAAFSDIYAGKGMPSVVPNPEHRPYDVTLSGQAGPMTESQASPTIPTFIDQPDPTKFQSLGAFLSEKGVVVPVMNTQTSDVTLQELGLKSVTKPGAERTARGGGGKASLKNAKEYQTAKNVQKELVRQINESGDEKNTNKLRLQLAKVNAAVSAYEQRGASGKPAPAERGWISSNQPQGSK